MVFFSMCENWKTKALWDKFKPVGTLNSYAYFYIFNTVINNDENLDKNDIKPGILQAKIDRGHP